MYQALRCSMSTLQPQGPPKSGHTNHTEKHPRPQRPTPTNNAPSTANIHHKLEHMENKHPHIHQCIPPQHTNARIGQRYAEAAHIDKSRGAKPIGQLHSSVALQQHTKPTTSGDPSQWTRISSSAISPITPREPGSPKANPEHPNSKGTKVVIM